MNQSNQEVIDILQKTGAVVGDSHFVGTSGKHMDVYVNKDNIYPHTAHISRIAEIIAEKYKNSSVDIVVGPSMGGIILSQWVAHHLSLLKGKEILSIYTEKQPDKDQIFTRGYDVYVRGRNVLIVEDIVTTGGSLKKVINSVQREGGRVIGVCAIVNKDPANVNASFIGAPFDYLSTVGVAVYDAVDCSLCKNNVPINTTLGHGKKYLEAKQK
ncbi:MAG: phosphoribosyltransferase family protein [Patescibacteria group bacterium]